MEVRVIASCPVLNFFVAPDNVKLWLEQRLNVQGRVYARRDRGVWRRVPLAPRG
jgi:hypothetical protein